MDLVVVFALFVFMLALLCFCVATVFSANKDLRKSGNTDVGDDGGLYGLSVVRPAVWTRLALQRGRRRVVAVIPLSCRR